MDKTDYTGGIMALYSWFRRNAARSNNKNATIKIDNKLIGTPESGKYIENYTMWPTAKLKEGAEIVLPVEEKLAQKPKIQNDLQKLPLPLPLKSALSVGK